MRSMLLAALAALAFVAGPASAADPAEGDWMIDEGARVHFAPCAAHPDLLCGTIAWLKDPNGADGRLSLDAKNPNPALRGRTILGMPFITDLKRVDTGRWAGGHVYNSDNGMTYQAKMHTHADGTLKFEGCVLLICGARTWHRPETASRATSPGTR